MQWSRSTLLTIAAVAVFVALHACGGSSGKSCTQGTESCPCYGNSTCNPGLTCASNTCVSLGGAGGATGVAGIGGTTGSGATGGSSRGGAGGASASGTGGASSAGTGGKSTAGAGGTAAGGSAGAGSGGSGGGSCTSTSTDPMNCGACGHVCKSADPVFESCPTGGCCAGGKCGAYPASCITQQEGFTNCSDYCASIGETCSQLGCVRGKVTWQSWSSASDCQTFLNPAEGFSIGTCDATISWDSGTFRYIRCCCTDTH